MRGGRRFGRRILTWRNDLHGYMAMSGSGQRAKRQQPALCVRLATDTGNACSALIAVAWT